MGKREYLRAWHVRNRDKVRAYQRAHAAERNARQREKYRESPELRRKLIASARKYKLANPLQWKATKYGIDVERLEQLWDRGCMICGAGWAPGITVKLHTDHDHRTGQFRGVLCEACNFGLGQFHDDPMLLTAAADYILQRVKQVA